MNHPPKVLLVEDDLYYAESIMVLLKKIRISPLISSTISEAKRTVAKHRPDIAVIDVMFPAGSDKDAIASRGGFSSGLVLSRWIAEHYPDTKLIGYSNAANPEFTEHFERLRGQFIVKLDVENGLINAIEKASSNGHFPQKTPEPVAEKPTKQEVAAVFIVHGHDDKAKYELKNYVQNTLHLPQPVILHEQPNLGRTIIEKFEDESEDVGVVFVLLTPDDAVHAPGLTNVDKRRARQNVIFETGYFLGLLGRRQGRVILLHKGPLELPTDISGLIYIDISNGIEAAGECIRRELAGLI